MKLTRRKLAVLLASGSALAQTPVPPPTPDSLLQTARERNQANARALDAEPIPMSTEPAFQFKA